MPQIQAGETFVTGQQLTAVRANNHVNGALLLPGAISEQADAAAIIAASANPSSEVDLLGRSVTTGNLVKVNAEDLLYNLQGLTINGILNADAQVGNHLISGHSQFIATTPGVSETALSITSNGYQISTSDLNTLDGTQVDAADTGVYSIQATNSISLDAPSIYTGSSEIKIGQTGKLMYEDPLVAGTYIDITDNVKDKRKLYDVVINEVNNIGLTADSGNRYSNYAQFRDLPDSVKATFTYVVPAGEKWIIEYDGLLNYATDDAFAVMYTVNDVVNYYVQSAGASNTLLNFRDSWVHAVCHRIVLTEGTHTVKLKVGFYGGTGGDYLLIFGRLGWSNSMVGYASHPHRWSETINKFKI